MPSNTHKDHRITDAVTELPLVRKAARGSLGLDLTIDLVLCGVFLACLSSLALFAQPALTRLTFITGLVSGGLCVLWGVLGWRGVPSRLGAIATLMAAVCVFARQIFHSLSSAVRGESKDRMAIAMMTVLIVLCTGVLAKLALKGKYLQSHEAKATQ